VNVAVVSDTIGIAIERSTIHGKDTGGEVILVAAVEIDLLPGVPLHHPHVAPTRVENVPAVGRTVVVAETILTKMRRSIIAGIVGIDTVDDPHVPRTTAVTMPKKNI